jgi:hypothetical protein
MRAAGGDGAWGRAMPVVPGGVWILAPRVSTFSDVVTNAAMIAIAKAAAKIANTVRWFIIAFWKGDATFSAGELGPSVLCS